MEGVAHFIEIQLFSPLSRNLLYWAIWALIHSSFGLKNQKPAPTIGAVCREGLSFSEFDVQPWQDQGRTRRSLLVPNIRISSSTLSGRGTMRLVCTPRILARASLEEGVTSPTRRIPRACNWRLIVFIEGYGENDEEGLPQILTLLLRTKGMVATSPSPRLLPVSLFRMMKIVTTNGGVRVRRTKVWVMTL